MNEKRLFKNKQPLSHCVIRRTIEQVEERDEGDRECRCRGSGGRKDEDTCSARRLSISKVKDRIY